MSAVTSSAPAAQQQFTQLLADAFDAGEITHVSFAGKIELPSTLEVVWVLPVRNYRRAPGEQYSVETFDLAARFEVFRSGDDTGAEADTRRWELIDAAEAALLETGFKGYENLGAGLEVVDASLDPYDKGWVAVSIVTFGVSSIA